MSNELKRLQDLKRANDLAQIDAELAADYEVAFAQLERIAANRSDAELMNLVQALRGMAVPDPREPFRLTAVATMLQVVSLYLLGGQAVGRALEFTTMLHKQVLGAGKEG